MADLELAQLVFNYVAEHGPVSGSATARGIRRAKGDVLEALRVLRRARLVRRSRDAGWIARTGSVSLSEALLSEPPAKPRISRHVPDAALEDIAAGRIDGREWAQRELERRGKRAA
jgi:hypothetical protein